MKPHWFRIIGGCNQGLGRWLKRYKEFCRATSSYIKLLLQLHFTFATPASVKCGRSGSCERGTSDPGQWLACSAEHLGIMLFHCSFPNFAIYLVRILQTETAFNVYKKLTGSRSFEKQMLASLKFVILISNHMIAPTLNNRQV